MNPLSFTLPNVVTPSNVKVCNVVRISGSSVFFTPRAEAEEGNSDYGSSPLDFETISAAPAAHREELQRHGLVAKICVSVSFSSNPNMQCSPEVRQNLEDHLHSPEGRLRLWYRCLSTSAILEASNDVQVPAFLTRETWPLLCLEEYEQRVRFYEGRWKCKEVQESPYCTPIIDVCTTQCHLPANEVLRVHPSSALPACRTPEGTSAAGNAPHVSYVCGGLLCGDAHPPVEKKNQAVVLEGEASTSLDVPVVHEKKKRNENLLTISMCIVWMPYWTSDAIRWSEYHFNSGRWVREQKLVSLIHQVSIGLHTLERHLPPSCVTQRKTVTRKKKKRVEKKGTDDESNIEMKKLKDLVVRLTQGECDATLPSFTNAREEYEEGEQVLSSFTNFEMENILVSELLEEPRFSLSVSPYANTEKLLLIGRDASKLQRLPLFPYVAPEQVLKEILEVAANDQEGKHSMNAHRSCKGIDVDALGLAASSPSTSKGMPSDTSPAAPFTLRMTRMASGCPVWALGMIIYHIACGTPSLSAQLERWTTCRKDRLSQLPLPHLPGSLPSPTPFPCSSSMWCESVSSSISSSPSFSDALLYPFNHPLMTPDGVVAQIRRDLEPGQYSSLLVHLLCLLLSPDPMTRPRCHFLTELLLDVNRRMPVLRFPFALGSFDVLVLPNAPPLQWMKTTAYATDHGGSGRYCLLPDTTSSFLHQDGHPSTRPQPPFDSHSPVQGTCSPFWQDVSDECPFSSTASQGEKKQEKIHDIPRERMEEGRPSVPYDTTALDGQKTARQPSDSPWPVTTQDRHAIQLCFLYPSISPTIAKGDLRRRFYRAFVPASLSSSRPSSMTHHADSGDVGRLSHGASMTKTASGAEAIPLLTMSHSLATTTRTASLSVDRQGSGGRQEEEGLLVSSPSMDTAQWLTLLQMCGGVAIRRVPGVTSTSVVGSSFLSASTSVELTPPTAAHPPFSLPEPEIRLLFPRCGPARRTAVGSEDTAQVHFSGALPWHSFCTAVLAQQGRIQSPVPPIFGGFSGPCPTPSSSAASDQILSTRWPSLGDGTNTPPSHFAWILPRETFSLPSGALWMPAVEGGVVFWFHPSLFPTAKDRYFAVVSRRSSTLWYAVPRTAMPERMLSVDAYTEGNGAGGLRGVPPVAWPIAPTTRTTSPPTVLSFSSGRGSTASTSAVWHSGRWQPTPPISSRPSPAKPVENRGESATECVRKACMATDKTPLSISARHPPQRKIPSSVAETGVVPTVVDRLPSSTMASSSVAVCRSSISPEPIPPLLRATTPRAGVPAACLSPASQAIAWSSPSLVLPTGKEDGSPLPEGHLENDNDNEEKNGISPSLPIPTTRKTTMIRTSRSRMPYHSSSSQRSAESAASLPRTPEGSRTYRRKNRSVLRVTVVDTAVYHLHPSRHDDIDDDDSLSPSTSSRGLSSIPQERKEASATSRMAIAPHSHHHTNADVRSRRSHASEWKKSASRPTTAAEPEGTPAPLSRTTASGVFASSIATPFPSAHRSGYSVGNTTTTSTGRSTRRWVRSEASRSVGRPPLRVTEVHAGACHSHRTDTTTGLLWSSIPEQSGWATAEEDAQAEKKEEAMMPHPPAETSHPPSTMATTTGAALWQDAHATTPPPTAIPENEAASASTPSPPPPSTRRAFLLYPPLLSEEETTPPTAEVAGSDGYPSSTVAWVRCPPPPALSTPEEEKRTTPVDPSSPTAWPTKEPMPALHSSLSALDVACPTSDPLPPPPVDTAVPPAAVWRSPEKGTADAEGTMATPMATLLSSSLSCSSIPHLQEPVNAAAEEGRTPYRATFFSSSSSSSSLGSHRAGGRHDDAARRSPSSPTRPSYHVSEGLLVSSSPSPMPVRAAWATPDHFVTSMPPSSFASWRAVLQRSLQWWWRWLPAEAVVVRMDAPTFWVPRTGEHGTCQRAVRLPPSLRHALQGGGGGGGGTVRGSSHGSPVFPPLPDENENQKNEATHAASTVPSLRSRTPQYMTFLANPIPLLCRDHPPLWKSYPHGLLLPHHGMAIFSASGDLLGVMAFRFAFAVFPHRTEDDGTAGRAAAIPSTLPDAMGERPSNQKEDRTTAPAISAAFTGPHPADAEPLPHEEFAFAFQVRDAVEGGREAWDATYTDIGHPPRCVSACDRAAWDAAKTHTMDQRKEEEEEEQKRKRRGHHTTWHRETGGADHELSTPPRPPRASASRPSPSAIHADALDSSSLPLAASSSSLPASADMALVETDLSLEAMHTHPAHLHHTTPPTVRRHAPQCDATPIPNVNVHEEATHRHHHYHSREDEREVRHQDVTHDTLHRHHRSAARLSRHRHGSETHRDSRGKKCCQSACVSRGNSPKWLQDVGRPTASVRMPSVSETTSGADGGCLHQTEKGTPPWGHAPLHPHWDGSITTEAEEEKKEAEEGWESAAVIGIDRSDVAPSFTAPSTAVSHPISWWLGFNRNEGAVVLGCSMHGPWYPMNWTLQ